MKRTLLVLSLCLLVPLLVSAQDNAVEEQINRLRDEVSALQAANVDLQKRLSDVHKELQELRTQSARPSANYAGAEDLKQLAEAVKEVDRKREADRDLVVAELKKLAKTPAPSLNTDRPASDDQGYPYVIQSGDTLSAVVQAYREQGVKVTVDDVLKANPGIKANSLKVGDRIFIPRPKR